MAIRRRFRFSLLLWILLLSSLSLSCNALYTLALWDFNSHHGSLTVPQYNTDSKFIADLSPLGSNITSILVPGRDGTCVFVDGKSFNLATGLGFTCLRDLDECGSTWILQFWLKIEDWNIGGNSVIMRTTNLDRTEPGLYIGKAADGNILLYIRGSSGKTLWRTFSQEPFMNNWGYLFITANERYIIIRVNSKVQSGRATVETLETTPVTPANFVVGDDTNGPTFYLDDVRVRYPGTPATSVSSTTRFTTVASTTVAKTDEETTQTPTTTSMSETSTTTTATSTEALKTTSAVELFTSMRLSVSQEATTASLSTTIGAGDTDLFSNNIWIPIVIGVLAFLVVTFCLLWLLLCRRRRKSGKDDTEHELTERNRLNKDGYVRASTVAPDQDEGSQVDTDGNNTDREENRSFVKK